MIVLSAKDLTKEYDGTNLVLDKISFSINKGDRVGIIGINGAGKSTLLKVLTGQLSHEEGDFFVPSDLKIGFLQQDAGLDSENTIIEEVNNVFAHFPEMEKDMERLIEEGRHEQYEQVREKYARMGGYQYQSE
ncbi:MAG: ABC-F family ATP-binding cassette domain-containing protein, partial [Firmicutes bacterium]|nr:ABC-F family ATP-binding cassette domain-containing protein [Bacillota bacterium]